MKIKTVSDFRDTLRKRYAWPGGYDILLFGDEKCLCVSCARKEFSFLATEIRDKRSDRIRFAFASCDFDSEECEKCGSKFGMEEQDGQ